MHKLTVFGSARMDAFLELPPELAEQYCKINSQDCFIELSYASKLPLNNVSFCVGGNGANVSVGAKRLGVDNFLIAELGQGAVSDMAKAELGREIDLKFVTQSEGMKQGFGAVIVYQGERTILSYYSPGRPPFPKNLERSEWAYLTSVGDNFEEYYEDVLSWLSKTKTKLAFNPGGRQINKGKDWLEKYLSKTEIILVNRQEAEKIVGMSDSMHDDKKLLDALSELGPRVCVITDGRNGSFVKEDKTYYKVGIFPLEATERTGAGDSYSAGFLSAIMAGKSVPDAMLWGTLNAASVIGYVGPEEGLLKKKEMGKWLKRAKSSGVEVLEF